MSHGLQVYNESGILQIDSLYKNMSLVSSGSVICSGNDVGLTRYADVNITGTNPILALREYNHGISALAYAKSGNVFTFRIYAYLYRRSDNAVMTDIPVNYWVFDSVPNTPTSGHGLHVYNANGQLAYDSNNKYFKILHANAPSGFTTFSGKTLLIGVCDFGYGVYTQPTPNQLAWNQHATLRFAKLSGNDTVEIFVGLSSFRPTSGPAPGYGKPGAFALLDVTGYGI